MNLNTNSISFMTSDEFNTYLTAVKATVPDNYVFALIDTADIMSESDFRVSTLNGLQCTSYGDNWDSWLSVMRSLDWIDKQYIFLVLYNMNHINSKYKSMWDSIIDMCLSPVLTDLTADYRYCNDDEIQYLHIICVEDGITYES